MIQRRSVVSQLWYGLPWSVWASNAKQLEVQRIFRLPNPAHSLP
jgi:hypothetical protein